MDERTPFQKLPATFTKNGYCYRMVARTPTAAIYEQRFRSGGLAAYEVIRVRRRAEKRIGITILPAREVLPSNEEWGRWGWTFSGNDALQAAKAKMYAQHDKTPKIETPPTHKCGPRSGLIT